MLTLFATPKPFRGETARLQRMAMRSWTRLRPRLEILLIGDEEGTQETCRELGFKYVAEVERNAYGTPLARSVFRQAQTHATNPLVSYISADIVLLNDFMEAVRCARETIGGQPFLLIGGLWNVERIPPEMLEQPDWEAGLKAFLGAHGWQDRRIAMDYFVFPRGFVWALPDFPVGRPGWESWLPYYARRKGITVIDGGKVITAIHQKHDHRHHHGGELPPMVTPEGRRNMALLGFGHRYTNLSATCELIPGGTLRKRSRLIFIWDRLLEAEVWLVYGLQRSWPWSYPLYVGLRWVKRASVGLGNCLRALVAARAK
jgi:hypothetical protein